MPTPPYLTEEEIAHITFPLTQGAARIKYFRARNIRVEPRPNGQPLVWRVDFDGKRAGDAANDGPVVIAVDWTKFDERVGYRRGQESQKR